MKMNRIKGKLILVGTSATLAMTAGVSAQVVGNGLSPASNTSRSFQDASIARDSNLNQPLDLLNDFYPAIAVTITDHQNARRRPDIQEDDLVIVAQPSLGYRTNIGRHQFYAAYNGNYTFHQDLTEENAESHAFNGKLGLDLTRRWDLDVFAGYADSFESRGVSGSREFNQFVNNGQGSGPESVEFVNYGADLTFGRKIGVVTAVLGYEFRESSFQSNDLFNNANAGDRDRESESVHFDLNWKFASKTSVFGRIERSETDFDVNQPSLDSSQTDYLLGLRFKPANALSGVVGLGRSDRDFDESGRDGFNGSIYYVNLNYAISPFSNITLNASNLVEESSDINASFFESQLIGASWSHALSPKWGLDAYAKVISDDFNTGREDEFVDWGVGINYIWRNWLTAGLFYGEVDRDSNVEGLDFDDQFIGIRLRSDLRSLLEGRGKKRRQPEPSSFDYPKKTKSAQ